MLLNLSNHNLKSLNLQIHVSNFRNKNTHICYLFTILELLTSKTFDDHQIAHPISFFAKSFPKVLLILIIFTDTNIHIRILIYLVLKKLTFILCCISSCVIFRGVVAGFA